jgi:hypothetical protein
MMHQDGPIAYAESTTSKSIFEEDLNRMVQVYADESVDHKADVLAAMGKRYDLDREPADTARVIKRHHDLQNWLQKQSCPRVGIPFHEALTRRMPIENDGVYRVAQQDFTVIEVLVVLQQNRRERRKDGFVATLDDYALARQLLLPSVQAAFKCDPAHIKAQNLMKFFPIGTNFTTPEVKKSLGSKHDMGASRLLKELVEAELVKCTQKKSGETPAETC